MKITFGRKVRRIVRLLGGGNTPERPRSRSAIFDHGYSEIVLPWDIGKPQPELVHLAQTGGIEGRVLDIGCGSGENVLFLYEHGLVARGVDISHKAIELAKHKAKERKLGATFMVGDALHLPAGDRFDTVIDCGLFHVFTEQERKQLAASIASALKPGGRYVMLTFSQENGPGPWPRGANSDEISEVFTDGWRLEFIRPARFETRFEASEARGGLSAWLASFRLLSSA